MEYVKIIEECETRPNTELLQVMKLLEAEHEDTKNLILKLSEHLDKVEEGYHKVNNEIKKRTGK